MSRRFRLTLFVGLAAATGLHLRPCVGTLRGDGAAAPAVAADLGQRPALGALDDAPTRVGADATLAEVR